MFFRFSSFKKKIVPKHLLLELLTWSLGTNILCKNCQNSKKKCGLHFRCRVLANVPYYWMHMTCEQMSLYTLFTQRATYASGNEVNDEFQEKSPHDSKDLCQV